MLKNNFEDYKKFFSTFGTQIKFGIYNNYGMDKEKLKDLVLFYSSNKKEFITLNEYVDEMKEDQKNIYYASGETIEKIDNLPQVEQVKQKEYDILYLTDYVDEFTIQALMEYKEKKFMNVSSSELDLETKEEKEKTKNKNKEYGDIFNLMKDMLLSIDSLTEARDRLLPKLMSGEIAV